MWLDFVYFRPLTPTAAVPELSTHQMVSSPTRHIIRVASLCFLQSSRHSDVIYIFRIHWAAVFGSFAEMAPTRVQRKQTSVSPDDLQRNSHDPKEKALPRVPLNTMEIQRSPIKRRKLGITLAQKQTLIDNLQLESTRREDRPLQTRQKANMPCSYRTSKETSSNIQLAGTSTAIAH